MENPYQSSSATQVAPVDRIYKDAGSLTLLVKLCLLGSIVSATATILASLRQQSMFAQAQADGSTVDEAYYELGFELFAPTVAQFVFLVAGYVIAAMWIYRIASNTRYRAGARFMDYTPGWAVGWYFIPFANLWKPYQAMKELWTLNFATDPARPANAGALLPLWWFLWLAWNTVSNVAGRMAWRATTFDQEAGAATLSIVSDAIGIVLCLLFLSIVHRLYAVQKAHGADPAPGLMSAEARLPVAISSNEVAAIPDRAPTQS